MPKFELKSFVGGLSDYEDKGIKGAFKFGSALDIRKKADSLSCQQALVDEGSGVIVDLILFLVPCSDGNTYGFGDTGRIYKRTSGGTWSVVYTDTDGKIIGAAEWYNNAGKTFLDWATATKLNRKEIPGQSDWSDVNADAGWPKTNLSDEDWHTMKMAGGSLMIANGQYLAMVGYDDSYTNQALNLLPQDKAKTLIERNNLDVIVGATRKDSQEIGNLFSWREEYLSYAAKKPIPSKGINALIDSEYTLMQAGVNGGIYYSDLVNVLPITSFPGGGKVNPDGVDVDEGLALFGVFGGSAIDGNATTGVYTLGRKKKNAPFVLNLDYPFSCDEIGSVKNIGTDILVSYKSGSTYRVKKVDTANKATAIYQSLDLIAPSPFTKPVVWEAVKITTKDMPTGTKCEVWYRVNKKGNFVQAKMEGEVAQFTSGSEAIFLINSDGKICEVLVKLIPNGNNSPEVYPPVEVSFS